MDTYQNVEITGNVVVEYSDANSDDQVLVEGNPDLISNFEVRTENNILYLEADSEVQLEDSVYVILGEEELDKIILNAQQQAVLRWDADENDRIEELEIETRGGSQLWFYGLNAGEVDLVMKGNSEVYLDSRAEAVADSVVVPQGDALTMDDYVIHEGYIYKGDSVGSCTRNDAGVYVIYADEVERHYLVENMNIRTVGNTRFEARHCAVEDMDIGLTGNSEANVWVIGSLSGEGKGSSVFNYFGTTALNLQYIVTGGAVINLL